jgi:hypothetical protein
MSEILKSLAEVGTAIGVFIAAWQLWRTKQQAVSAFEDQLAREYRQLAQEIPVDALLGKELSEDTFEKVREQIYNYIDLSNEQTFLRKKGRISKVTWNDWCDGIKSNLSRPVLARVWAEVKEAVPESFQELRQLESGKFLNDPRSWKIESTYRSYNKGIVVPRQTRGLGIGSNPMKLGTITQWVPPEDSMEIPPD